MDRVSGDQLKIDLHQRTRERMHTLACDTFALYEMAGLESRDAAVTLAEVLMTETAKVLAAVPLDASVIANAIAVMVRFERGEVSRREMENLHRQLGRRQQ